MKLFSLGSEFLRSFLDDSENDKKDKRVNSQYWVRKAWIRLKNKLWIVRGQESEWKFLSQICPKKHLIIKYKPDFDWSICSSSWGWKEANLSRLSTIWTRVGNRPAIDGKCRHFFEIADISQNTVGSESQFFIKTIFP